MALDELDLNLLNAWDRVLLRCRDDPDEARRRWARSQGAELRRPVRAWCLAIRSSDTRMFRAIDGCGDQRAPADHLPHEITLDATAIRRLCEPVRLDWPGVRLVEAAAKLGRHVESLRHWLHFRPGRRREVRKERDVRRWDCREDPTGRLHVRYESPRPFGHKGYDVPVVWSPRPFDPNAKRGEPPHPIWGSMWLSLVDSIPADFAMTLIRAPRKRVLRGQEMNRGWDWLCPGLPDEQGQFKGCGRRAMVLYAPLPIFTINHYCNAAVNLPIAIDPTDPAAAALGLRLVHPWRPGLDQPAATPFSFACKHCWRIRNFCLTDYRGWNTFVTHLSGGLLYGHEVPRPAWLHYQRKRECKPRPRTRDQARNRHVASESAAAIEPITAARAG